MVDYKAIADGDPDQTHVSDLATAYQTMKAEMVNTTPLKRMSYRAVANECGYDCANKLSKALNSAIGAGSMPKFIEAIMNNEGLDVNDVQVVAQLDALVASPIDYDQTDMDKLIATGVVSVPKYTNLRMGHLQNAREKRLAGKI